LIPDATPAAPPRFQMIGTREAVAGGMIHIERQVTALEDAVADNPGLVFDLAKALVESTCRSILDECSHPYSTGWEVPKLLKETTTRLQLVPDGSAADGKLTAFVRKALAGLQTTIQGMCELRNAQGFSSHGKSAAVPELEALQALLVARSADAIIHFLFHAHRQYNGPAQEPPFALADHPEFNAYVDEKHETVWIFEIDYSPSEVLFAVAPEQYRKHLTRFTQQPAGDAVPEDDG
jgi:Abortive infection C-terminus